MTGRALTDAECNTTCTLCGAPAYLGLRKAECSDPACSDEKTDGIRYRELESGQAVRNRDGNRHKTYLADWDAHPDNREIMVREGWEALVDGVWRRIVGWRDNYGGNRFAWVLQPPRGAFVFRWAHDVEGLRQPLFERGVLWTDIEVGD